MQINGSFLSGETDVYAPTLLYDRSLFTGIQFFAGLSPPVKKMALK